MCSWPFRGGVTPSGIKKDPLTKRAEKTVRNALLQALEWGKAIDEEMRESELAQLYNCSLTMVQAYSHFLGPSVRKAILENRLAPRFTISDFTRRPFLLDLQEQEVHLGVTK